MSRVGAALLLFAIGGLVAFSAWGVEPKAQESSSEKQHWYPFVIPPDKELSARQLLEPYWSKPTPRLSITNAQIEKTFVQVDLKVGNTATGQMFLLKPDDADTVTKLGAGTRVENADLALLIRCEGCQSADVALLKSMAGTILENQQKSKETLWIAQPKPEPRVVPKPSTFEGLRSIVEQAVPSDDSSSSSPTISERLWHVRLLIRRAAAQLWLLIMDNALRELLVGCLIAGLWLGLSRRRAKHHAPPESPPRS